MLISDRSIPAPVLEAALDAADAAFVADFNRLISAPWPTEATVRAGTTIAGSARDGLLARRVPGQRAILAKRMRGRAA